MPDRTIQRGRRRRRAGTSNPDVARLKALANPVRMGILESLTSGPKTVRQIAAALEESRTKLYRHIEILRRHGLIEVASRRMVSGIAEKTYRATRKSLTIDRPVPAFQKREAETAVEQSLETLFERTRADIARSIEAGHIDLTGKGEKASTFCAMHGYVELSKGRAADFARRLQELIREMSEKRETRDAKSDRYGFTITFYPSPGGDEEAAGGKKP